MINNYDYKACFTAMVKWMEAIEDNKSLSDYLLQCGYKNVAIYEAREIGRLLYNQLKNSSLHIECIIERNAESLNELMEIPVIRPSQALLLKNVDVIIVTPFENYDAVNEYFMNLGINTPTISLRDMLYEL